MRMVARSSPRNLLGLRNDDSDIGKSTNGIGV